MSLQNIAVPTNRGQLDVSCVHEKKATFTWYIDVGARSSPTGSIHNHTGWPSVSCRCRQGVEQSAVNSKGIKKVKVWTLAIVPFTWVRLVTSSALQSRKWQLIGMSQWCRSALCGHPLPALMDNWTHGAASRHTIAPISHIRPSPHSRSYYSFPVPLRVGGWVGLSTQ